MVTCTYFDKEKKKLQDFIVKLNGEAITKMQNKLLEKLENSYSTTDLCDIITEIEENIDLIIQAYKLAKDQLQNI